MKLEQLIHANVLRPHGVRRLAVFLGLRPDADLWEVLRACKRPVGQ
jgi:hypothetical protein